MVLMMILLASRRDRAIAASQSSRLCLGGSKNFLFEL